MPHLLAPRKGWENERLASYLLSRFGFVAQPSSVLDDLGSDFFCTNFEIVKTTSGRDALRPLNSFAIQVKSSAEEIEMDNKIDYLQRLELPRFQFFSVRERTPMSFNEQLSTEVPDRLILQFERLA